MTLLSGWLKQIVMVVLLAVIADLLLPTRSMQKYVRAFLGLAIVAAMLQPVIPLLHGDWADRLTEVVSSELTSDNSDQTEEAAATEQMKNLLRQDTSQVTGVELLEDLQAELPADLAAHVVDVQISGTDSTTKSALPEVTVVVDAVGYQQRDTIETKSARVLGLGRDEIRVVPEGGEGS